MTIRLLRLVLLLVSAIALAGCRRASEPPRLVTDCRSTESLCTVFRRAVDESDGAPLPWGTLTVPFTQPVRVADGAGAGLYAVTASVNLETGAPGLKLLPVRSMQRDPNNPRRVLIEIDGLPADGAAIDLPDGAITDGRGRGIGPIKASMRTEIGPFDAALAGVVWEPADPSLFSDEGVVAPRGQRDDGAVRRELEARLRLRPGITDEQVRRVLARYNGEPLRRKAPDHRVRAGLLLLTGTSAEYAIDFIARDTNRRGVPFAPIAIEPIADLGAFALVSYDYEQNQLQMIVDPEIATESLENIAVVLAHEILHSSTGDGSASEETLAMASNTRVYEELLLIDPAIARSPTAFTRAQNRLTLALRNSGRFGNPRAGILPRSGVSDALRGVGGVPARSFRDLLLHPAFYGGLRRSGDVGTEVLESYYRRISGLSGDQGRIPFDDTTLKRFDEVMDNGFTDAQILAIAAALGLKPVPLTQRGP